MTQLAMQYKIQTENIAIYLIKYIHPAIKSARSFTGSEVNVHWQSQKPTCTGIIVQPGLPISNCDSKGHHSK